MAGDRDNWIDVGALSELERDGHVAAFVDDTYVTIVGVGGELYCYEDRCTHDGESLSDAGTGLQSLQPGAAPMPVVICPRHGAHFCLRTGAALTPPAYEPLRVFAVRARGERILVRAAA
jgi:3-phenylpropionate/trans-cinnamate dioxygenase ferredoxin subunit